MQSEVLPRVIVRNDWTAYGVLSLFYRSFFSHLLLFRLLTFPPYKRLSFLFVSSTFHPFLPPSPPPHPQLTSSLIAEFLLLFFPHHLRPPRGWRVACLFPFSFPFLSSTLLLCNCYGFLHHHYATANAFLSFCHTSVNKLTVSQKSAHQKCRPMNSKIRLKEYFTSRSSISDIFYSVICSDRRFEDGSEECAVNSHRVYHFFIIYIAKHANTMCSIALCFPPFLSQVLSVVYENSRT